MKTSWDIAIYSYVERDEIGWIYVKEKIFVGWDGQTMTERIIHAQRKKFNAFFLRFFIL
jgi:hypothetical protein